MTKGIIVKIVNNTGADLSVSATVADTSDWGDGVARPDLTIKGSIPGFGSNHWHQELAQTSATAPFTVCLQSPAGQPLMLHLDGWQVRTEQFRRRIPTPDDSVAVFQYTGTAEKDLAHSDWKQLTISVSRAVDPLRWMSELDPSLTLSEINIPGTHDSGTCGASGVEGNRTQTLSITDQLVAGIRWFDFRLWPDGADMGFWHGIYRMPLKLSQALRQIQEFLAHNPDETVITCVKIEKNDPSDQECTAFDALLRTIYTAGVPAGRLYQDTTTIPSLGDVRGHVVLLRRDRKATFGLLAHDGWPSNDTKAFPVNDPKYYVEDEFQFYANGTLQGTIDEKFSHVERALDTALSDPDAAQWWPMIFASASLKTAPLAGYYPWNFAAGANGVNGLLFRYLIGKTRSRFGTIIMDYPEEPGHQALINLILAQNPQPA